MKIWLFTCETENCENKNNPVRLTDAINPVLCGGCGEFSDAVETAEEFEISEII
jgi:hypothetical protein